MYNISLEIKQRLPGLAFFFTSRILLRARWSNFDRSASEGIIYLNIEVKISIKKIFAEVRIKPSNYTRLTDWRKSFKDIGHEKRNPMHAGTYWKFQVMEYILNIIAMVLYTVNDVKRKKENHCLKIWVIYSETLEWSKYEVNVMS